MKKLYKSLFSSLVLCVAIAAVLNLPLKTRQGVDGVIIVKKIPLYAKVCGFLYRDYQYRELSNRLTQGIKDSESKIMAIYTWTINNIKKTPHGFTVVDDHIWNIIVRGYGKDDQMADVFTTLASYAGYDAFWDKLRIKNDPKALILSFVKINHTWHIFDIYNKKCFITKEELQQPTRYGPTYAEYLETMDKMHFKTRIKRPDKQKIIPRIILEIKKLFIKPTPTRQT